ncbi:hypothetical protein LTR27_002709 [Elasticomyces elasticus]|nr:hypothetical protein LTR27_002709 [Elasticomyces elasticus]
MSTEPVSAVTRVFGIQELLEKILLAIDNSYGSKKRHLQTPSTARVKDLRSLLVNQRVNKAFYAAIKSSPAIRQALFFSYAKDATSVEPPVFNTLLVATAVRSERDKHGAAIWHSYPNRLPTPSFWIMKLDFASDTNKTACLEYGSWRRMLLTSRPMDVHCWSGPDMYRVLRPGSTLLDALQDLLPTPPPDYPDMQDLDVGHACCGTLESQIMPTAASRVFHIPELLEAILLHLLQGPATERHVGQTYDFRDYLPEKSQRFRTVLVSQRVSKTFYDTITGSPSLQRALDLTLPAIPQHTCRDYRLDLVDRKLVLDELAEVMGWVASL